MHAAAASFVAFAGFWWIIIIFGVGLVILAIYSALQLRKDDAWEERPPKQ